MIRAVLFDLGDTLMYPRNPEWKGVLNDADDALTHRLLDYGLQIDHDLFRTEFRARLKKYYAERDVHLRETSNLLVLQELLAEKGLGDTPEAIAREALDALYAITQQNWVLEEDAIPCLEQLQADGFKMGIVSNAGDNKDVFELVEKFGIEPYFDFVLTSAACGVRKPHPQIFAVALAHWQFIPEDVAMVGDKLDADIKGADGLGIFSVWIRRRTQGKNTEQVTPAATVDTLSELPGLFYGINHQG